MTINYMELKEKLEPEIISSMRSISQSLLKEIEALDIDLTEADTNTIQCVICHFTHLIATIEVGGSLIELRKQQEQNCS